MGGSAAWRGFNAGQVARSMAGRWRAIYCGNKSQPWSNFESNRGGSSMQGIPAFPVSLSLEGVSQMVYILPERLLALVRPAFDLVLRRIPNSADNCVATDQTARSTQAKLQSCNAAAWQRYGACKHECSKR